MGKAESGSRSSNVAPLNPRRSKSSGLFEACSKRKWSATSNRVDYIMGDDVDVNEPEVVKELTDWGIWYTETTGVDGFRLDAVKSIDAKFFQPWLTTMREHGNHPDFAVGARGSIPSR